MRSPLPPLIALFLFLGLAACGDQTGSGVTAADVAYIRAKRYQELYGVSSTSTSTVSSVVTITSVTTVSATTVTN